MGATDATKKAVKRGRAKKKDVLDSAVIDVPVDRVTPYPHNPRKGNVDLIAESLEENGQFRPIIVQKSTSYILGGNHTYYGAVKLGWAKIKAVYIECDDEEAKRIVLADNRTSDLAGYDDEVLGMILATLENPTLGTGYDQSDIDALINAVEAQTGESMAAMAELRFDSIGMDAPPPVEFGDVEDDWGFNEGEASAQPRVTDSGEPADDGLGAWEKAEEESKGAFTLKTDMIFEKVNYWGIPPLRDDMLVTEDMVPRNLIAWAGSATKDWPDPDQWWLYNFGIDSTSGMQDISKCILSFYAFDEYFDPWWVYPDRYTMKTLNSGIKMALTPDWSLWADDPHVVNLWNLYKARWMGRYFQEAGIKVIPNICWPYLDRDFLDKFVLPTLPKRVPVIAMQLQTFDPKMPPDEYKENQSIFGHILSTIKPDLAILYVGKQAIEYIEGADTSGAKELLVVNNRMDALSKKAGRRAKKTTL